MAQSLVSRIGASPVWRAGLASAFILGLAGFAAGVMPQACRNGFIICQATAPEADVLAPIEATVETPAAEAPAPELVATADVAPPAVGADTSMIARQPASITRNDLIAQTFAALDVELSTASGELTARKVRTVEIGPDGMPVITEGEAPVQVAEAPAAEPEPEPEAAPVEVAEAEVPAISSEEPVAVEEEQPAAVAYAPVRGSAATVGRQGANVRSLPQTRGSDVLFTLASGAEVTIVETQKGWHKVVDASGRSGWIWDDLLNR